MDRVGGVSRSYGSDAGRVGSRRNGRKDNDQELFKRLETEEEKNVRQEARERPGAGKNGEKEPERQGGQGKAKEASGQEPVEEQAPWSQSVQDWLERRQKAKEEEIRGQGLVAQLQARAEAVKKAFDPKRKKNLYDATMDLTLLEQIEKVPALKAMQSRLMFKIRAVKASGASSSEVRIAVSKLKKVLGKVKAKVKGLQKEELLERRRKLAEEAKRKAKEEAIRREKELRKKIRKAKERKDIEESKMGMGANYGGPSEGLAPEFSMDAYGGAISSEVGAAVDMAVSDMTVAEGGAAPVEVGGAVDLGL